MEEHERLQTTEDLRGFSDAEIEAQNLEKSLKMVNKQEEDQFKLAEQERLEKVKSKSTMDLYKHVYEKTKENDSHTSEQKGIELLGEQ